MRTKLSDYLKRAKEESEEEEEEVSEKQYSKKSKTLSKEEEKAVQSSDLSAFFGASSQKTLKSFGSAHYEDFPSKSISIWHWNINGVNTSVEKGTLQAFLKKAEPMILSLNEIKVDQDKLDKSSTIQSAVPKEYQQYWNCCSVKKGYAGTALFTKVKPISVTFDLGISKHDGEGRVITAEFKEFILVAVYVPNSGEGLKRLKYRVDEWDKDFQEYLQNLRTLKKKPLILTGDLNVAHHEIDIYDPKGREKVACFTPQERASFGKFLDMGYVDTFRNLYPEKQEFSFWSARINGRADNRGWRLDYFVVSKDGLAMVEDSTIHNEYLGSDHCPIQLKLNLSKSKKTYQKDETESEEEEEEKDESEGEDKKKSKSSRKSGRKSVQKSKSITRKITKKDTAKESKSEKQELEVEEDEQIKTAKPSGLRSKSTKPIKKAAMSALPQKKVKANPTSENDSSEEEEQPHHSYAAMKKIPVFDYRTKQIYGEAKRAEFLEHWMPDDSEDEEDKVPKLQAFKQPAFDQSIYPRKTPAQYSKFDAPQRSSSPKVRKAVKSSTRIQQQAMPKKPEGPQWDDEYKKYDDDF